MPRLEDRVSLLDEERRDPCTLVLNNSVVDVVVVVVVKERVVPIL